MWELLSRRRVSWGLMLCKHFTFSSLPFPKQTSKPLGLMVGQGDAFSFWHPPAKGAELLLCQLGCDSASLPALSSTSGWGVVGWCCALSSAATSQALQPPGKVQWCWSPRVVGLFDGL